MISGGWKWIEFGADFFWPAALELLFAATLLLAIAALVNLGLCRATAALRHRVWALTMGGLLLLPLLCPVLPRLPMSLNIPMPGASLVSMPPAQASKSEVAAPQQEGSPSDTSLFPPARQVDSLPPLPSSAMHQETKTTWADQATSPLVGERPSDGPSLLASIYSATILLWMLGMGLGLVAMARTLWAEHRLASSGSALHDPTWQTLIDKIKGQLGVRGAVAAGISRQSDVPLTIGWRKPTILLPTDCSRWTTAKRRTVLVHELSHVARHDVLWQIAARLVCAIYWFHPLAWLAARRMRVERELACDDVVLCCGGRPDEYATVLLDVATAVCHRSQTSAAAVAMACRNSVERRIQAILQPGLSRLPVGPRAGKLLLLGAIIVVAFTAALHPFVSPLQSMADSSALKSPATGESHAPDNAALAHADKPEASTRNGEAVAKTRNISENTSGFEPRVTIEGIVKTATGAPAAGITVKMIRAKESPTTTVTDSQGRFKFVVGRGEVRYSVWIAETADGAQQAYHSIDEDYDLAEANVSIPLVLTLARALDIRVIDGNEQPVSGATVGLVSDYLRIAGGRSNSEGRDVLRVPADAPLQSLYAFKSGLGLDYLGFPRAKRATTSDVPQRPDLNKPLILKLTGVRTVRIKLTDPLGRPIEGIGVSPWYFQKPEWGHLDNLNIGGVEDFHVMTDATGTAAFDWIPKWNKQAIIFWPGARDLWTRDRIVWEPQKDPPEKTAQLLRTVPVRGRVSLPNGRPVAGILIQAEGSGRSTDGFRGQTWSDEKGRFEIRVSPGLIYLFAVSDNKWAAPARAEIAVQSDTPVDGIDFPLQSATPLHGQLTLGPEKKPWPGQTVTLVQYGPDKEKAGPGIPRWVKTDEDGRYVFHIGPGNYALWASVTSDEQKFTVTDQKELVYDFNAPRKQRGMITVRVVDRENPSRPVAHAHVVGVSVSSMSHANLEATTNEEGWFRVERWSDKMLVYAFSKDKKMAGSTTITPDDTEITIGLQPVGSAKGQVIDQATGMPAADKVVQYEVFYHYEHPASAGSSYLTGSVTTDDAGRFEISGLVPGLEYQLQVPLFKETDPIEKHRYDLLGKVTAKSGEMIDLDTLEFRREMQPGELLTAVLANQVPVDKRLKDMADEAKKRSQRVLIMFSDPRGESHRHLQEVFGDYSKSFRNYYVISSPVDAKQIEAAKAAFGKKWDVDLFDGSWPVFCILDTDGRTLAVKNTREFVKEGKVDGSLVNEFLKKHAQALPKADADTARGRVIDQGFFGVRASGGSLGSERQ